MVNSLIALDLLYWKNTAFVCNNYQMKLWKMFCDDDFHQFKCFDFLKYMTQKYCSFLYINENKLVEPSNQNLKLITKGLLGPNIQFFVYFLSVQKNCQARNVRNGTKNACSRLALDASIFLTGHESRQQRNYLHINETITNGTVEHNFKKIW